MFLSNCGHDTCYKCFLVLLRERPRLPRPKCSASYSAYNTFGDNDSAITCVIASRAVLANYDIPPLDNNVHGELWWRAQKNSAAALHTFYNMNFCICNNERQNTMPGVIYCNKCFLWFLRGVHNKTQMRYTTKTQNASITVIRMTKTHTYFTGRF